mgnify:CR=1 FL=1
MSNILNSLDRDKLNSKLSEVEDNISYFDSVFENEYNEICNKRKSCVKIFEKTCKEMQ